MSTSFICLGEFSDALARASRVFIRDDWNWVETSKKCVENLWRESGINEWTAKENEVLASLDDNGSFYIDVLDIKNLGDKQKENTSRVTATNKRLREIMIERGLDIRPDSALNRDVDLVADAILSTRSAVISWLSPEKWKSHRKMPAMALELLEQNKEKLTK